MTKEQLEKSLDEALSLLRQYVESDYVYIEYWIHDCIKFIQKHEVTDESSR